jgi:uncharacterized zinc-type alcohol dehydrogenase-like protein
MKIQAYAVQSSISPLEPFSLNRRDVRSHDVKIEILYCGVCHSDLHQAHNDWKNSIYPMVPGREIVGRIVEAGAEVTKFKVGDLGGVGCFVDSCRECPSCRRGLEQYCLKGMSGTYNGYEQDKKTPTFGGYSSHIVVDENYTLHVSEKLPLEEVAPLLCAGITTYSPLRHWKIGKGHKIGIVGLGGLGHMGVKFAAAFGAEVTLFSTSPSKQADAKRLGAHHFALTTDPATFPSLANQFDSSSIPFPPPRLRRLSRHARPRRRNGHRGSSGPADLRRAFFPDHAAAQPRGVGHRRHSGNPGDARLLRRAQHHLGRRGHPDPENQRGL